MRAPRILEIFGVPLDLGAGRRGVDMGPSAFRIAGVAHGLESLGCEVLDCGDIPVPIPELISVSDNHARYAREIGEVCQRLFERVQASIMSGRTPVTLGGDHSLAVGSASGSASACQASGKELGLLWVDAHGDMNTPETSPSGNVHGMPLACLLGKGPPEIVNVGGGGPKVNPSRCVILGLRNLDEREKGLIRASGVRAYTMKEIDRRGIAVIMDEALAMLLSGDSWLHVSFDMDSVDPSVSPGVGTPVRGGLSYRESHLLMEMIADTQRLVALDMVEVNPILDNRNSTARLGVELILSALGKNIL